MTRSLLDSIPKVKEIEDEYEREKKKWCADHSKDCNSCISECPMNPHKEKNNVN